MPSFSQGQCGTLAVGGLSFPNLHSHALSTAFDENLLTPLDSDARAIWRRPRVELLSGAVLSDSQAASVVTVEGNPESGFRLLFDGEPYFINGAGGNQHLEALVGAGGNSIRTWHVDALDEPVDGQKCLIERVAELGLTITAGIWVEHERHGFKYSDRKAVQKQRDKVRAAVRKFKDSPALLMWGLGNEMEGPESTVGNDLVWKELNELAKIIKEEDPNHPVMTVIAGAGADKVRGILAHYPEIDVLGVNAYGEASDVGNAVVSAGWKKPYVLTEFGPSGHWEVPTTAWGAPIEPGSQEKAASYYATQNLVIKEGLGLCLGSYVFLWGQKQEVTATWYGMFLSSGERTPAVDAMAYAWSGKLPSNPAPKILSFESPLKESEVKAGEMVTAEVTFESPAGDALHWEWVVCEESSDRRVGGDAEATPPEVPGSIVKVEDNKVSVKIPGKLGPYRLFVTVRDGKGSAAAENIPFLVKR